MRAPLRTTTTALAAAAALGLAGCGDDPRQDADEPSGSFAVDVIEADFPERQRLARQTELAITVRNTGRDTIPNLAVTVDGFSRRAVQDGVADPDRPIWVVDEGPRGGTTAYLSTWALGAVRPNETKRFAWKVTAVQPGRHPLKYRVAAGLDGRARAVAEGGGAVEGAFDVRVSRRPAPTRVDPETGEVVQGERDQDR